MQHQLLRDLCGQQHPGGDVQHAGVRRVDGVDKRRVQHNVRVGDADAVADLLPRDRLLRELCPGGVFGGGHPGWSRVRGRGGGGVERVEQRGDLQRAVRRRKHQPNTDMQHQLLRDLCGQQHPGRNVQHAGVRLVDGVDQRAVQHKLRLGNVYADAGVLPCDRLLRQLCARDLHRSNIPAGRHMQRRGGGGVERVEQRGLVLDRVWRRDGGPEPHMQQQLLRDMQRRNHADRELQHAGVRLVDGMDQRAVQRSVRLGDADADADLLPRHRLLWRVYTGRVPGVEHAERGRVQRRGAGGVERMEQRGDLQRAVRRRKHRPNTDMQHQLLRDM
jgi:hypothetical protein